MRILVVGINYSPESAGIGPYTGALARGLAQHHDVEVLTSHPHYPQWELPPRASWRRTQVEEGVRVTRLKHYVPSRPTGVLRIVSELSFALRVLLARPRARPDVIVVVTPALLTLAPALLRGRARGVPVAVIVQDLYASAVDELQIMGPVGGAVGRLERSLLRRADAVTTIHPRMAATIQRQHHVPAERLTVIRNWSHIEAPVRDRDSVRAELGWSGRRVVLHAGNMGKKQALEMVVDAARAAERRGEDLHFVIMGQGSQRAEVAERARGLANLELRDPVERSLFTDVLAAADVLLLHERPGLAEMCAPSKLTSYFAAGRPVLAATTEGSAASDEVRDSGAGVVVPSGEAERLVQAAVDLMSNPDEAVAMGRRGQDYAREHLSEESALAAFDLWLEQVASGQPSSAE